MAAPAPKAEPMAEAIEAWNKQSAASAALVEAIAAELTPDERAAWDKAQARRRQRSQRTIPKDQ